VFKVFEVDLDLLESKFGFSELLPELNVFFTCLFEAITLNMNLLEFQVHLFLKF
jgi:hypothetical protein